METWKPSISYDRVLTFLYLFHLLREHSDIFLDSDLIEPITRSEIYDLMDWFEKAYDRRKALEAVNAKWAKKPDTTEQN